MLLSKAFISISKTKQKDASASYQLMLQTGMLCQLASGIYSWLPFGYRVLKKVEKIVREEMCRIGFQEMLMPTIQPSGLWIATGRYDPDNHEMLKIRDRHDAEFIYGPTAEDCITEIFKQGGMSYTQLPQKLYNIQWKFRDERRPRNGVMRSREFLMKDGYSFDIDEEKASETYREAFDAYVKIYSRLGLKVIPALADNGNMGGKISHDFHILNDAGEDIITFDKKWLEIDKAKWSDVEKYFSTSKEMSLGDTSVVNSMNDNVNTDTICHEEWVQRRSIEVGHIFMLGLKYTQVLGVHMQNGQSEKFLPYMGCYGIGMTRVVGAIIEQHHDQYGIVWPEEVSPYKYILVNLSCENEKCRAYCDDIYTELIKISGGELCDDVLYDDRVKISRGEKFNTADLLGIPVQIIIGGKECEEGLVMIKNRKTGVKSMISRSELLKRLG